MSTIPITKTDCIPVSPTKTVPYPEDYIGLLKLGVRNGDRIVRFMPDATISRKDQNDKPYYPREVPDLRRSWTAFDDARYATSDTDNNSGRYRGMGDGYVGYYNDNLAARCFELGVDTRVKIGEPIFIEYIADGFKIDTETEIYAPTAEFLKAYAMWQWNLYKHGAHSGQTEGWRTQYLRELAEYKAITSNLDRDVIMNSLSRTASTTPRF